MSRRTITATQDELLCKNGCGFYGNPSWQGYCSKCWKDQGATSHVAAAAASNIRKLANHAQQLNIANKKDAGKQKSESPKLGFEFDRFEKRRGQKDDRKSKAVKSIFKPKPKQSPTPKNVTPSPPRPVGESQQVGDKFADYLRTELDKKAALDVSKQVRAFIDKFVAKGEIHAAEQSEMVQDFYTEFQDRIANNPIYRGCDDTKQEELMNFMEKYLMTRLYRVVFSNPLSGDEEKDLKLQDKIRSLNWVTASMLETGIDDKEVKVRTIIDDAVSAIIEMDSKRAPADKLKTLVDSSKLIFEAIHASSEGKPASADDFLPSVIYLLLQSNPPLLRSNINFINGFSLQQRVRAGEAAYFFVNFCIAADFIADKLGASSLNMTENEFQRYMSGELTPEASGYRLASGYSIEGLRLLNHDLVTLRELKEKATKLKEDRKRLRQDIRNWEASVKQQVDDIIARTPMEIRAPKIKSIDDENPVVEGLPSPLIPAAVCLGGAIGGGGGGGLPVEWTTSGDSLSSNQQSTTEAFLDWASFPTCSNAGLTDFAATSDPQSCRFPAGSASVDAAAASAADAAAADGDAAAESPRQDTPSTGSPALSSLRSKRQSYDSLDLLEANLANLDSDDEILQDNAVDRLLS